MRIIGGVFKGKKIFKPPDLSTRPLKDLTKESIFNILNHSKHLNFKLEESLVLDLFCGTGSFGLECISRGAANVTFVENYKPVLKILIRNIDKLKCHKKIRIIENNIIEENFLHNIEKKFHLIFLDPPYKENRLNNLLTKIIKLKILSNEGLIIIHRHKKTKTTLPNEIDVIEERSYGISKIIFGKVI